ncbi:MAG: ABC-three component system protein [Bacteroidota bacterium]
MEQNVENNSDVANQLNVSGNHGNIYMGTKSRFSKRFEKLNTEVTSDTKYEGIMDALKHYLTKLDGVDMPTKLQDGGFTEREILTATRRKEQYAKKLEKSKFYESAQWINSQLFAKIKINFEAYVEPLINSGAAKDEILLAVVQNVITPVLALINEEGEHDTFLNYDAEDVFGMIYYLTGKCHINWKNYDSIQPSV